ncbi:MAG TPA: hypothetical protein VFY29_09580 [Terriglobia bacterium]|nr:hypothetical protein [Terriglobia bacterium]
MTNRKKPFFAFNLWLFDLTLTALSFLVAYKIRAFFSLSNHLILPIESYFWMLALILPVWAVVLPVAGAYPGRAFGAVRGLSVSWAVVFLLWLLFFRSDSYPANRLLFTMTLLIDATLLVVYRYLVLQKGNSGTDRTDP